MASTPLPTYVSEAFVQLSDHAESLIGFSWPVLLVVFGGLTLMKLFKKFGSKAT